MGIKKYIRNSRSPKAPGTKASREVAVGEGNNEGYEKDAQCGKDLLGLECEEDDNVDKTMHTLERLLDAFVAPIGIPGGGRESAAPRNASGVLSTSSDKEAIKLVSTTKISTGGRLKKNNNQSVGTPTNLRGTNNQTIPTNSISSSKILDAYKVNFADPFNVSRPVLTTSHPSAPESSRRLGPIPAKYNRHLKKNPSAAETILKKRGTELEAVIGRANSNPDLVRHVIESLSEPKTAYPGAADSDSSDSAELDYNTPLSALYVPSQIPVEQHSMQGRVVGGPIEQHSMRGRVSGRAKAPTLSDDSDDYDDP